MLRVFITNLQLLQDACNEAEQVSVPCELVMLYPQAHMIMLLVKILYWSLSLIEVSNGFYYSEIANTAHHCYMFSVVYSSITIISIMN